MVDKLQLLVTQFNLNICTKEFASKLDSNDSLSLFRKEFHQPKLVDKPDQECIYFNGNSLGLQPIKTKEYVNKELDKWKDHGVEGHFVKDLPWVTADEDCVAQMARIVGAKPIEVVLMNSLTTNLHLMMIAFYRPTKTRNKILIEDNAFPSDIYAVSSQIQYHGYDANQCLLKVKPRSGEYLIHHEDILELIKKEKENLALILISGVQYSTGQFFNIKEITKIAHEYKISIGFDLAHAVGNVPLSLHDWNVDFAVWCCYKYLNGGPGTIGGCFLHEKHASNTSLPRFAGWWGHRKEDRFEMNSEFIPSEGVFGFQLSNPSILSLASTRCSLDIFDRVDMKLLREKSVLLTGLLEYLLDFYCKDELIILTSKDPNQRGCQLSLSFKFPVEVIHHKLSSLGVFCDLRRPFVMRVAPCPLYNTFEEVWKFVQILKNVLKEQRESN